MVKRAILSGVGGRGRTWRETLKAHPDWEAAAYVDVDREVLRTAAEQDQVPLERCFTDLADALKAAPAEALVISTPPMVRVAQSRLALEAGLHILSEKPLVLDWQEALTIREMTRQSGRIYSVAQNYRYAPASQAIKRVTRSGDLGTIAHVEVTFRYGPRLAPGLLALGKRTYRGSILHGFINDMCIHHFDMLRVFFGEVRQVWAADWPTPWVPGRAAAGTSSAAAMLQLENGAWVTYYANAFSARRDTDFFGRWVVEGEHSTLFGSEREVTITRPDGELVPVEIVGYPRWSATPELASVLEILDEFGQAIETGCSTGTNLDENLRTLAVVFAAVESANAGRPVAVEPWLAQC